MADGVIPCALNSNMLALSTRGFALYMHHGLGLGDPLKLTVFVVVYLEALQYGLKGYDVSPIYNGLLQLPKRQFQKRQMLIRSAYGPLKLVPLLLVLSQSNVTEGWATNLNHILGISHVY